MGHRNFCCDGCQTRNFHGRRFHCLRCVNYDLCGECYDQRVETLDHRVEHPMQLLLQEQQHEREQDRQLPELLLNGELLELMHLPNCYTCPYCGIFGHTAKELIDHVVTTHRQADSHVVCPMCAGLPGIELVAIRNLARHLLLNHIEHANLLDPHTPPLRHALARVSRRRRRQQQPNPSALSQSQSQSQSQPGGAQRGSARGNNNEAGIDILYQLSELRRLRPELRLSQTPANYLEGESQRPRPHALSLANVDALLLHGPATASETNGNGNGNGNGHVNGNGHGHGHGHGNPLDQHAEQAGRYLLPQWMAERHAELESALRDGGQRRQQHALFAEHLLLSMLCEEQLQLPQPRTTTKPKPKAEVETEMEVDTESAIGSKHLLFEQLDEEDPDPEAEADAERRNEDLISLLRTPCKYIPSQIMMLMSLPWLRPWSSQSELRYTELQGVTLDESTVDVAEPQDID